MARYDGERTEVQVAVCGGRLQNLPRGDFETPAPGARPLSTALVLRPV